jgi:tetratricopeptide (TPR) repeat protein
VIYKVLSAAEAYQNGQFKEALNRYDLALEMTLGGPGKYYVLKKQGDCHRHLGEYVQAERSYREAVETSPEKDGARAGLAIALYRLNRFEEAQVEIEKIKKRNSTILYIHARIYAFWWIDKARFEKDELFEKARDLYSECQNYSLGSASPWCYYDEAALFSLRSRARNVSASEKAGLARQAVGLLDPALKKARENTESMYRQMRDRLVSDKDFDPIRDQEEFKDFLEEQGYTKIRSAVGRSDGGS